MDLSLTGGLAEHVHRRLQEQIVAGAFLDGHRIVEREIAEELRVSRGPVRDAIRMLEVEGLVVTSPRRGSRVAVPTEADAAEIYELREALEPLAATMLVVRADPQAFADLEREIDVLERAVRSQDWAGATNADMRFHGLIFRHSGNRRFLRIWEGLEKQLLLIFALHRPMYRSIDDVFERHRDYLDVLRVGDVAAIREHVRKHVTDYRDGLLVAIRAGERAVGEAPSRERRAAIDT
ncbi:MAG: GntR family transcriptional regulator [Vulcanimicrobiaceae bacterium]